MLIAMLEAMGNKMFRTKVLTADDVTYAEEASVFLKREEANLTPLVAARLKSAVHILLFNVNGIRAARKWVLQLNTRCGILYLIIFEVDGVLYYYIGESKKSFCDHGQLCNARWSQHSNALAIGEHINPNLQKAYCSASHPSPAPTDAPRHRCRTHGWLRVAVVWNGVCASPGAPVRPLAPALGVWPAVPDCPRRKGDPVAGAFAQQENGRNTLTKAQFFTCCTMLETMDRGDGEEFTDFVGRVLARELTLINQRRVECSASGGRAKLCNIAGVQFEADDRAVFRPDLGVFGTVNCRNCTTPFMTPNDLCDYHEAPGTSTNMACTDCGKDSRVGTCIGGGPHTSLAAHRGTTALCAPCHSGTRQVPSAATPTRAMQTTRASTAACQSGKATRGASASTTKPPE